jgi:hypothetical protein
MFKYHVPLFYHNLFTMSIAFFHKTMNRDLPLVCGKSCAEHTRYGMVNLIRPYQLIGYPSSRRLKIQVADRPIALENPD